ncbi:hypothetical protein [Nostoc commune]|uniref:hypothetical protein n=1 Tax=Nostoc commune TaxID=1178 RepID=UPI0022AA1D33|nr:hypothetical protein [Nostoc commune]
MRVESQLSVERVIKTLKEDLPTLFEKDISYHIYTEAEMLNADTKLYIINYTKSSKPKLVNKT